MIPIPQTCVTTRKQSITLPVLQRHSVNFFIRICLGIRSENGEDFQIFRGLRFPGTKHERSSKISGKIRSIFRSQFGTKIRKIRGFFVLCLFLTLTDADPIENDMSARKSHIAIRERIIKLELSKHSFRDFVWKVGRKTNSALRAQRLKKFKIALRD